MPEAAMDAVLRLLDEAHRILLAELARTGEAVVLGDLQRMIERAKAAHHDQHAGSLTVLAGRVQGYLDALPLSVLVHDLGDLMHRRDVLANKDGAVRCDEDV